MDLQLTGKVAIVTGGSRGLGFASARALIGEGCHVAICARGAPRLERAAAELRAAGPGEVLPIVADVSSAADAGRIVEETAARLGGVDILVNNVGLAKGAGLLDTSDDVWHEAFDQTLFPAIRISRAAVPHMQQRGGGAIVIVASIWGREGGGRMTYNVVKAGEISLGKALAQQFAKDNVRVVCVAPGSILFPGGSWDARQQADPEGIAEFVKRELPFGRFGQAEEVGNVVAFLASPKASWVSGTTVVVDGCQSRMF